MKVLVLTTTFPRWGGDPTPGFVYELSKRLRADCCEIHILTPHCPGAKRFEVLDGMKVYRYPYFYPLRYQALAYEGGIIPNLRRSHLAKLQLPFLFISGLLFTMKIVRSQSIDLIHSHWILPNGLFAAIAKKIFGVKHVTTAHAGDVFTIQKIDILKGIGASVLRNADFITANSNFTKNSILDIDESVKERVEIIPMGVDTHRFHPGNVVNLKQQFGAEQIILSVGRLVEKKGLKYLILAMPSVLNRYPNAKLLIGGSGPEKGSLKELVGALNLENSIVFLGYISNEDIPQYFASADLFVLPSVETKEGDTEGLGVVLLEALASGTPVIGSNIGGITDVIIGDVNGFLVNPGDPVDIAEKIIYIFSSDSLQYSMSNSGVQIVTERFSWDLVARKFSCLLSKAVSEKHL